MKSSLDELFAAALHDDLTPEERAALDTRLQNDPAVRAAYQETLLMHDLLEKTHREVQPGPAFEQRMISGVRRKIQHDATHSETAWESAMVLWNGLRSALRGPALVYGAIGVAVAILIYGSFLPPITGSLKTAKKAQMLVAARTKSEEFDKSQAVPMAAPAMTTPGNSNQPAQVVSGLVASNTRDSNGAVSQLHDLRQESSNEDQIDRLKAPVTLAAPSFNNGHGFIQYGTPISASQSTPLTSKSAGEFTLPNKEAMPSTSDPFRKLIRNARLELEVKSYQSAVDQIGTLIRSAGGYLDTSNSQRGGNGKLQGTIVVKVLPANLDSFLVALRGLGEIKNQSVDTEDVTKAYYDTQARLDNARRMETQLQELLKHDTNKVHDLLEVERELGRVRGEIEQMQGELKLYDFQVQFATVTITMREKDLNHAAAYLLRERDDFSLFAPDVEAAFQRVRQAADEFKADVLSANLNHDTPETVSGAMTLSVPPEQIEGFLERVRSLGRVENFTRHTDRIARDGGNTDEPADQTRTEKDRVMVTLNLQSERETPRQQTSLAVRTDHVDATAQQLKQDAAGAGAQVTASSFEHAADGGETASLTFVLPLAKYPALLERLEKTGKVESLTVNRDDRADANAPAQIDLQLHNERQLVPDDNGLWATLRKTFGEGAAALLNSVRTIGVVLAFLLPWLVLLVIVAWVARRVYVRRRK